MKRKARGKENGSANWPVILLILCVAVCVPVAGILTWRASDALSNDDLRLLTGVLVAAAIFVADTAILSLFLVAYSSIRRAEEILESRHEEALVARTPRQETRYNYTIKPGQPVPYQIPFGQTYPQQPTVEAPPRVEYVDNGEVTLGG